MKIYTRYDRPESVSVDFSGENGVSRTQQHFKKECDINEILRSFKRTGVCDHVSSGKPMYGDFTAYPDFQQMQDTLVEATRAFEALPASLRDRFGNDPRNLVAFVMDENNRAEAEKLGLVARKEVTSGENLSPIAPVVPADSVPTVSTDQIKS